MSASHHVIQLLKSAASSPEMPMNGTTGLHKALGKPRRSFSDRLHVRQHANRPTMPVALPYTSSCVLAFGIPPGHWAPQPAVGHHRHTEAGQGAGTQVGFGAGGGPIPLWFLAKASLCLPSSAPINHFHAPAERYDISAWRMLGHPREPVLLWQGCETKETSASETLLYSLLLKKQNLYVL